ncbi:MAG: hypothetical protein A7316_03980 [Candidatus Altiarchaeales archaeon WOR_SM1_86-2]|nr:MAG: hypothetical protein A7316_03980 [Candidatus Altiarchaeales archaeon WOR_SM1_86-2]ODS39151.1 MAG: hypothetical protein A7315_11450 [Candidatus Altiarchaeales archaeon WOR_SM1_79]
MKTKFDVIVIGAGPAGAAAAEHIAKAGFDVLLIEKDKLPRKKVCAGIAPPRIYRLIKKIPESVIERRFKGYHLFSPSGAEVKSGFLREGVIMNREKFDNFLVEKAKDAGAEVIDGLKVSRITDDEVVTGKGAFNSKVIVGADGANSFVRNVIGMRYSDLALGLQYTIELQNELIDSKIGNWFEVHYGIVDHGHGWIAPHNNKIKAGIGSTDPGFRKNSKEYLNNFIEKIKGERNIRELKIIGIESHLIPVGGPLDKPCKGNVILIGDAAGFVNPLTGEGIYYAVKSGKSAADAAGKFLENEIDNLEHGYISELKKKGLMNLSTKLRDEILSSSYEMEEYIKRLKKLEKIGKRV